MESKRCWPTRRTCRKDVSNLCASTGSTVHVSEKSWLSTIRTDARLLFQQLYGQVIAVNCDNCLAHRRDGADGTIEFLESGPVFPTATAFWWKVIDVA